MSVVRTVSDTVWTLVNLGAKATDSDDDRIQKAMVTLTALIIAFLAIFWGSTYVLLGHPWSGAIPLSYAVVSVVNIGYFFLTQQFRFFRFSQLLLILLLPFLLMWSLGGFAAGSVVMIWAFFTPLAALLFVDQDHAWQWLGAFLGLTVLSGLLEPYVSAAFLPMTEPGRTIFFAGNMGLGCASIFVIVTFFVRGREETHQAAIEAREEAIRANQKLAEANRLLEQNEAQIRELMLTDSLTGLANRRHLNERMNQETERSQRYGHSLSVIICDIDHFKGVNDTFGHSAGDAVICRFARVIADNARSVDFAARFGGEEFVILLPETERKGAEVMAHRIRDAFKKVRVEGVDTAITASFGIATRYRDESGEQTLQRADKALYQSKREGRNRVTLAD